MKRMEPSQPIVRPLDEHTFFVRAEASPLKNLSRAWRDSYESGDGDLRCCWYGFSSKNLGEWVGRSVDGHYYKSGVPLTHNGITPIPIGTFFVCTKMEKNKPFCADPNDMVDEDMVGDFCTFETLHPDTGERLSFSFWAHQQGFPQFERITNQMVSIAIAATGL